MNELALFAGAGGGILAGKLMGWRTVCAVERDAYARGQYDVADKLMCAYSAEYKKANKDCK